MEHRPSDPRMAAWHTFLQTYATLIPTLEREMKADKDLPLLFYDVLSQLAESPERGRLRMQDLAESLLLLSRSGLTRLIERMEKRGLVTREHSLEDRRIVYTVITPEGISMLEESRPIHSRGIHQHFLRHLDDEDIRGLQVALAKVLKAEGAAKVT